MADSFTLKIRQSDYRKEREEHKAANRDDGGRMNRQGAKNAKGSGNGSDGEVGMNRAGDAMKKMSVQCIQTEQGSVRRGTEYPTLKSNVQGRAEGESKDGVR